MPRPMVIKQFRNPRVLSSAFAVLGTLQPQAFGFLNYLVTLISMSNFYVVNAYIAWQGLQGLVIVVKL